MRLREGITRTLTLLAIIVSIALPVVAQNSKQIAEQKRVIANLEKRIAEDERKIENLKSSKKNSQERAKKKLKTILDLLIFLLQKK